MIAVAGATVAAVAVSVARYGSVVAPRELVAFARAGGDAALAGQWDHLYADSFNQSGPLQAPLDALLVAAVHTGWVTWLSVAAMVALAWFAGTAVVAALLVSGRSRRVRRWLPVAAVVVALVTSQAPTSAFRSGHWWQVVVVLCWVAAGVSASTGKSWVPVLALLVAALFEPWAILGLPVLVFAPTWRRTGALMIAAVLGQSLLWAPFVLSPAFHMTEIHWFVREDSLWHLLGGLNGGFPWAARTLQATLVMVVGLAAAWWWTRRSPLTLAKRPVAPVVMVVLVIVCARIACDAWYFPYYVNVALLLLVPLLVAAVVDRSWAAVAVLGGYGALIVGDAMSTHWTCAMVDSSGEWSEVCATAGAATPAWLSIHVAAAFATLSIGLAHAVWPRTITTARTADTCR